MISSAGVTANSVTNTLIYNASDVDQKDNRQMGSLKAAVSLPTGNIHIGEKYKATYVLKDLNLICKEGFNWAY